MTKPRFLRGVLLAAAGLIFVAPFMRAQTVESVLRGLQERQMALEVRRLYFDGGNARPLRWTDEEPPLDPPLIPPFPADGTITDLPKAIQVLNRASRKFDEIKRQYTSFDTRNHQFVNLSYEPQGSDEVMWREDDWIASEGINGEFSPTFVLAPIDLPSVGTFDEKNWRQKLIALASNIEQLKTLWWPAKARTATAQFKSYYRSPDPTAIDGRIRVLENPDGRGIPDEYYWGSATGWHIEFPDSQQIAFAAPDATY